MNKVKFNLNLKGVRNSHRTEPRKVGEPKEADIETLIMMVWRHTNGIFKYSTGEKIPVNMWNATKQRAKVTSGFLRSRLINSNLDRLERTLTEIVTGFNQRSEIPTNAMLKAELDVRFHGKNPLPGKIDDITTWVDIFIEESVNRVAINTRKAYVTTGRFLKDWLNGQKLSFGGFTSQHYKEFADFLQNHDLVDSTVSKYIKTLKTFINAAVSDERTTAQTNPINNRKLGLSKQNSDDVYLNEGQLQNILDLNLDKGTSIDKARDAFIVACYTGLRVSDLKQLRPEHVVTLPDGRKILSIVPIKTKQKVEIPLKPIVEELLIKHNFNLLNDHGKDINSHLKVIGEMAKIDAQFTQTVFRKGKTFDTIYKTWQLISSHTGRRSFVTNTLSAGIPPYAVMKMTGHKTLKSFETYIKFTERDNAIKLLDHDFFK